jgi:hypothetical protein
MALFQVYHFMGAGTIAAQERGDGYLRIGISYLKPGDIYDKELGLKIARERARNAGHESTRNAHKLLCATQSWLDELVITMRYAEQCGIGDSLTLRECVNFNMQRVQNRVKRIITDSNALSAEEKHLTVLEKLEALARVG